MTATTLQTTDRLAAGVIGVGAMGENHARVYSELQTVSLEAVADVDTTRATDVAARYGATACDRSSLLDRCDLVSVAVPTSAHVDIVSRCFDADVHVLVEKPIAERVEAGRRLARRADREGLLLQVGHIERFNPALDAVREYLDGQDIVGIGARRLGPPVDRSGDDGVIVDLMIHDLDVVTALLGAAPASVSASATPGCDYATATLTYDDGIIATFTASRLTKRKVRQLWVTTRECHIEVDYLEQSVTVHRDSYPEYISDDGRSQFRYESVIERPRVSTEEPLRRELAAFVRAVRGQDALVVSPADGLEALGLAREIEERATGGDWQ